MKIFAIQQSPIIFQLLRTLMNELKEVKEQSRIPFANKINGRKFANLIWIHFSMLDNKFTDHLHFTDPSWSLNVDPLNDCIPQIHKVHQKLNAVTESCRPVPGNASNKDEDLTLNETGTTQRSSTDRRRPSKTVVSSM